MSKDKMEKNIFSLICNGKNKCMHFVETLTLHGDCHGLTHDSDLKKFCLKGSQVRNFYMKIPHQRHSPLSGKAKGKSVPIGFSESVNAQWFF